MNEIFILDKQEESRIEALRSYHILDTLPEKGFDAIAHLASYICKTPVAVITFVDENRQWFKSVKGVEITQTPLDHSFCQYTIAGDEIFEVPDAASDSRFDNHFYVVNSPHVRFYAGVPLVNPQGYHLGTICVLDFKPNKLDEEQKEALKILAGEVISHLELRKKNIKIQESLTKYEDIYNMFNSSAELHCILDRQLNILMVNQSAEKITGYSAKETVGCPIWQFGSEKDMHRILGVVGDGLRTGQKQFEFETHIRSKHGDLKWIGWSVVAANGKWFANGRDISSRKKVVAELEQLSLVASKVANGVIISDENNNVIWVNDAFEHITGYNISDLNGRKLGDILKGEKTDWKVIEKARKHPKNKKSFAVDLLVYRKDGQPIWLSVINSIVLNDNGGIEKEIEVIIDITARKNAEQELETLSLVASKSSTGVVIRDADSKVTWVNSAFETILGYKLEELLGKQLDEVVTGEQTDKDVLKIVEKAMAEKRAYSVELLVYKKDGTPVWLFASSNPILNNDGNIERQVEIIVDITERKKVEEQVTLLSLVASKTGNGVVISDSKGNTKWINQAFEELIGYSLDEMRDKRVGDILGGKDTDLKVLEESRQLAKNFQPSDIELLCYKKNGSPVWLSISNTPTFNADGSVAQQVEIINDISERKKAEQELIKTREEALQLSKAKETFLSVMSHEIRTPLNAVIGMTHILIDDNPTTAQLENLKILKFSAENLLLLINDILDFTKAETGNMVLEKSNVNLKDLVSHTLNSLQFKTDQKNIILTSDIDIRIPEHVKGDNMRLYQILVNLLGNAIKFTDQGEVKLTLKLVGQTDKKVKVGFEVSDTGIGIAADKLNYIFETYTQASADTTRKYGGTGLGLPITRRLIELHNSEIYTESELGKGSKFSFTIEFEQSQQLVMQLGNEPKTMELTSHILIVDDNEINRLLVNKILTNWGATTDFAENGKVAVQKARENRYDMILMDLHMPVMDGLEATRTIRNMEGDYFINIPIIALTASIITNEMDKVHENGMNDYVLKPFLPNELFGKIQSYLKK